jgi:hypothetical protein
LASSEPGLHYPRVGCKAFLRHIRKYLRAMATLLENDLPVSLVMQSLDRPPVVNGARADR